MKKFPAPTELQDENKIIPSFDITDFFLLKTVLQIIKLTYLLNLLTYIITYLTYLLTYLLT